MAFQTKQVLDNSKFQQLVDSNLNLSGDTVIYGTLKYSTPVTLTGNTQLIHKQYVDELISSAGGEKLEKKFTQIGHTFNIGDVVGYNSVGNIFSGATATLNSVEPLGVITNVSGSSFTLCFGGYFNFSGTTILDDLGQPLSGGSVYYLSTTSIGKLSSSDTTEIDTISKPILTTLTSNDSVIHNYRGNIIVEAPTGSTGATFSDRIFSPLNQGQIRLFDGTGSGVNILGGYIGNIIQGNDADTIAGGGQPGNLQVLSGSSAYRTIGGGYDNLINGAIASTIAGGAHHRILSLSNHSTIGGGSFHTIVAGNYPTIGGGTSNWISGSSSVIAAGTTNRITGLTSSIGGGSGNRIFGGSTVIGGGFSNVAGGTAAVVGGGYQNTINQTGTRGDYSLIAGGYQNTLGSTGSGRFSSIAGGRNNTLNGEYSFIFGRRGKVNGTGIVLFSDSTDADFSGTTANAFFGRFAGGYKLTGGGLVLTDTRSTKTGIEYAANYATGYTTRSVVDKGYVTGLTNTLVTSANNGITKSGTNFRLGGTLTGTTTITSPATGSRLTFAAFPVQYGADLSANYNIRSLVDRGYVTGLTNTLITTANNGITKSGTNFRLGGSLTGATTITSPGTGSRLSFAGFPIQYTTDLSANFDPRSIVDKGYVTGITNTIQTKLNTYTGTTAPATYALKTVVITGVTNNGLVKTGQNVSLNESVVNLGNVGGTLTLNLATSRNFKCVFTGNTTLTFTNETVGATYVLEIETNTTNKTISYTAGKFRWSHGSAAVPQITQCTTNGSIPAKGVDLLVMRCSVAGKLDVALNYNLFEN